MTNARTLADNFAADINAVTAGTGITGGGTSGTVTVTNSMATAIDAKGDLVVGTGADAFSRLAVGATNGMVLTVDSAEATGLKYATPSSGAIVLIQKTSFSAASAVNFDTVFSSTYDNYLITGDYTTSGTAMVNFRYRTSGTNNTNNNYITSGLNNIGTGLAAENVTTTALETGNNADSTCGFAMEVISPNLSKRTVALLRNSTSGASYANICRYFNNVFSATTVFDGFSFTPASGTFTGTVSVYGYKLS